MTAKIELTTKALQDMTKSPHDMITRKTTASDDEVEAGKAPLGGVEKTEVPVAIAIALAVPALVSERIRSK